MSDMGITSRELREILTFVSDRIVHEEPRLNSLDAALGDGDHGITMRIGFQAIRRKLDELDPQAGFDTILGEAGMTFMSATGGAIGVILGKMFMAGGRSLKGSSRFGTAELTALLKSMEVSVASSGKDKPGDKTILDAIDGACQALAQAPDANLLESLTRAALAAETAAQNTANMVCRAGRASRLGDRALGHPDPGAVSFSIVLRA